MNKERIIIFLEYLFAFCVILDFNTIYREFTWFVQFTNRLSLFTIVLLLLLNGKNVKISHVVVLYLIGSVIPLLNIDTGAISQYVRTFILLVPLITLYFQICKRDGRYFSLLTCFGDIILVEAVISLLFWWMGSIAGIIGPNSYMTYTWNPNAGFKLIPSYYSIYFETQHIGFGGLELIRNSGIFMEGPMHNMVLCVALIIECFVRTNKSIWRICVIIVAIISTVTTTGYIFLMLMLAVYLYNLTSKNNRLISIFVFIVMLPIMYWGFLSAIEIKENTGGEGSVISRRADIERCIDVGFDNPVLGVGVYHQRTFTGYNRDNYGFSNSLFTVFAHGGFYLLILYLSLLFVIPLIRYLSGEDRNLTITILLFFVVFAITVSHYRMLTFMFLALSLSNIQIQKLHK